MRNASPSGGGHTGWGLPTQRALVAVYFGLSLMLVLVHAHQVNFEPRHSVQRLARHKQILTNTGQSPFAYRIAVPHAAEWMSKAVRKAGIDRARALEVSYLALRWVFIASALLLFHAYLSSWFQGAWLLAGTFLFAALHPASFFFYWYQPASALDLVIWLVAALVSLRGASGWWLIPLVALGALNRETVVFVTVIHFAFRYGREPTAALVARCAAIFGSWAVVFLGLRAALGSHPAVANVSQILADNLGSPGWWAYALAFFGALWVLPFWRWRERPAELRLLLWLLIPYLVLQLVFGRIREVRLLLPLAIVLIPLTLDVLRSQLQEPDAGASAR